LTIVNLFDFGARNLGTGVRQLSLHESPTN
jgi:hypothetical protein